MKSPQPTCPDGAGKGTDREDVSNPLLGKAQSPGSDGDSPSTKLCCELLLFSDAALSALSFLL